MPNDIPIQQVPPGQEIPTEGFGATEKVLQQGVQPASEEVKPQPVVEKKKEISPETKKLIKTIIKIIIFIAFVYIAYKVLDSLGIIQKVKEGFYLLLSI